MGKFNKLFTIAIIFFISILLYGKTYAQDSILFCANPESFFSALKSGKAASINKTAWLEEFSMVENSLITIYPNSPSDSSYLVDIKITDLKENQTNDRYLEYSILGYIFEGCTKFTSEYKQFINKSCSLITFSPEEAMNIFYEGITKEVDDNYDITGEIVSLYDKMCKKVKPMPVKKPAVYLYPEQDMNIKVTLSVNGIITKTEPYYNSVWDVFATKNGIINDKYDYLFYEADLNKIELPDEGWVVEYGNLENWFDKYLPALGLNKKETEQFKEYWLKDLKKENYYEIRLLDYNFLNENMKLMVSPKPQTLIRLNFYFKPLKEKTNLKEPEITKKERKGFTVVEWGGINEGDFKIIP
jgi:hypothetical protein